MSPVFCCPSDQSARDTQTRHSYCNLLCLHSRSYFRGLIHNWDTFHCPFVSTSKESISSSIFCILCGSKFFSGNLNLQHLRITFQICLVTYFLVGFFEYFGKHALLTNLAKSSINFDQSGILFRWLWLVSKPWAQEIWSLSGAETPLAIYCYSDGADNQEVIFSSRYHK